MSDRAREKARAHDSDSDDDSNSSSEDSDNAPLASFMRPSRPGSAASNTTSASRSRIPQKPLIDITKLTTPPLPPLPAPGDQPSSPTPPRVRSPSPVPEDLNSESGHGHDVSTSRSPTPSVHKPVPRVCRATIQLVENVISVLRQRRSLKAIETYEQVRFLVDYIEYLDSKASKEASGELW